MERQQINHVLEEEDEPTLTPGQLLQLAETHLKLKNFSLSRQYALESQQPDDPNRHHNHQRAAQIAAISDIFLATSAATTTVTNWYSVLQLDTFSNDHTLIRTQFKKLLILLDPLSEKSHLAKEALNLVWKAYNCLSNDTQKTHLDSQLALLLSNQKHVNGHFEDRGNNGDGEGCFWTFCPYCFYVYQYARVYEGCCLRCPNETCRRAFHGVSLCSLPRMELDKGQYFSCFGYFPLGFSPSNDVEKSKFGSWSPIVGLFPVRRRGKKCAVRRDFEGGGDGDDIVEISDESDESESPGDGNENGHGTGNVGVNMEGTSNVAKPQMMKRKSVAWNAKKLMSRRRRMSNEGADGSGGQSDSDEDGGDGNEEGMYGFESAQDVAGGSAGYPSTNDMNFFEEGGELYVGIGPDDAL